MPELKLSAEGMLSDRLQVHRLNIKFRAMALQALDSRLAASKPTPAATSNPLAKSTSQQSATSAQPAASSSKEAEAPVEAVVFDASKEGAQ